MISQVKCEEKININQQDDMPKLGNSPNVCLEKKKNQKKQKSMTLTLANRKLKSLHIKGNG